MLNAHCGLALSTSTSTNLQVFTGKSTSKSQAANKRCMSIQARGGGNFGDDSSRRLILPGQDGPRSGGQPGRLIVPGGPGGQSNFGGGTKPSGYGLEIPDGGAPQVRNFRPPPGFMDSSPGQETDLGLTVDDMLNKIRSRSAHWHELARLLPHLHAKGYPSEMVEEATGTERRLQSIWTSALQVYESLRKNEDFDRDTLAYYDNNESEHLLYELRFLSAAQRVAAAQYMKDESLGQQESLVLARAIKEHERRKGEKEGFSNSPADCLAYKYYRDALETRKQEDVEFYAKKGLAVADTDAAKAALQALFDGDVIKTIGPTASLTVLRLARDEIGFRPIAVAGTFQTVTAARLKSTPKASSEGIFGNFRIPADGVDLSWVALPAWAIIALAKSPVALTIDDCGDAPGLREALALKSKDDNKKLMGQGLLVADLGVGTTDEPLSPADYYMVESDNGGVTLVPGHSPELKPASVLGKVLFLCRPPSRDSASASTSELLQV